MTADRVRLTDRTTFEIPADLEIERVHLKDLSFVLDVETDGDEVTNCTIDVEELLHAMILYSAVEKQRHSWRR